MSEGALMVRMCKTSTDIPLALVEYRKCSSSHAVILRFFILFTEPIVNNSLHGLNGGVILITIDLWIEFKFGLPWKYVRLISLILEIFLDLFLVPLDEIILLLNVVCILVLSHYHSLS